MTNLQATGFTSQVGEVETVGTCVTYGFGWGSNKRNRHTVGQVCPTYPLSKAEFKGESNVNQLADKLAELSVDKEAVEQVRVFAAQEKHHGEITKAIIDKYAGVNEEENKNKNVYLCSVCGFEYVGDLDKESDDYICPICGCKKGVFKLQG